jgi:hypothetical protein
VNTLRAATGDRAGAGSVNQRAAHPLLVPVTEGNDHAAPQVPVNASLGPVMPLSSPAAAAPYALSASSLSQAEMPLSPAFLRYEAFSAAVQRKSTRSEALALAGRGGRPLPRFGAFMGSNYVPTKKS